MRSLRKSSLFALVAPLVVGLIPSAAFCIDPDMAAHYKSGIIDSICQDGGAWMKCYKLDPLQCQKVSASFVDACFNKLVVQRTSPVADEAEVRVVSDSILSCIRSSFKARHGEKRDIPDCSAVY